MTMDTNAMKVRYGRINKAMVGQWLQLDPKDDGPFWALNLMKYREVADYGDAGATSKSGREADDEYTPRESLAGIGAQIVFAADVERTLVGDDTSWDRIGIVRYPSRRAFFEMQQRDDFKNKHVHKDAGMEFTIVMSCLPAPDFNGEVEWHPFIELRVSTELTSSAPAGAGVFEVEGVIVGDERTWKQASFRWLAADSGSGQAKSDDSASYVLLLRPSIDRLSRSVQEARSASVPKVDE